MFPDVDLILNSAISLGIVLAPIELYIVHLVRPLVAKFKDPLELVSKAAKIMRMGELSSKGVVARQQKAAFLDVVAAGDPAVEWLMHSEFVPDEYKSAIPMMSQMLQARGMSVTQMLQLGFNWGLDKASQLPQLKEFAEKLKAASVLAGAEKIG